MKKNYLSILFAVMLMFIFVGTASAAVEKLSPDPFQPLISSLDTLIYSDVLEEQIIIYIVKTLDYTYNIGKEFPLIEYNIPFYISYNTLPPAQYTRYLSQVKQRKPSDVYFKNLTMIRSAASPSKVLIL